MAYSIPHLETIQTKDRDLYEGLRGLLDQLNTKQIVSAPEQVAGFNVTAANGVHDIAITDNSKANPGLKYQVFYSQTPDFSNKHMIDLGESQNHRANLGSGQYYWAVQSKYPNSLPSKMVFHGKGVAEPVGSGEYAGPAMQAAQGPQGQTVYRKTGG